VSTAEQNLDLQRDALEGVGCKRIYEEQASGKNTERPALTNCLKALRSGDVLVVWRLDRLGRNLPDLVKIVADLEAGGIGLESITENIETASSTGKLVFHVFAALAEFERNVIRERTLAGLKAARARGRLGTRLLANCVIYSNASILSELLERKESRNDLEQVDQIKRISPVSWKHVNFYGEYTFRDIDADIDIQQIVDQLEAARSIEGADSAD